MEETLPLPQGGKLLRYTARTETGPEQGGLIIASLGFEELFSLAGLGAEERAAFAPGQDLFVHPGGWQSWSAGWELAPGETLPRKVALIPELIKLTSRDRERRDRGRITGHFILYLRAGERYLCLASGEGRGLPPLTFYVNRKKRLITLEIFAPGKAWKAGETLAELMVFSVRGFFALKDALKTLYPQEDAFKSTGFLRDGAAGGTGFQNKRSLPGGYESWYNHYTDISEGLILEDLEALGKTDNLLKLRYLDRGRPLVFQIDDGWERAVGDWEINRERFPRGLRGLAEKIEAAGLIPGLWLAPFLATRRARIFRERPEWLLQEAPGGPGKPGKPVAAGFNHLWDGRYYCLDLSRRDVLDYLDNLIGRAIDEWGFRYLKLDFLYTGLFAGAFAEGGSPHGHYGRACAVLTRRTQSARGLPIAYLGCGAPLGPSYRYFPLSRIGADTREEWDWALPRLLGHTGRPGAWINLRDTVGRTHLDGAVYLNDPDVIFLRTKNCRLGETEKELIALVNFLLAGQIMFSDDPRSLEAADLALSRRINGLYETLEDDEYGARRIGRDLYRLESRSGRTWGLINLDSRPQALDRGREPELFRRLAVPSLLVDRRLPSETGRLVFAPRSISLGRE